MLELFLNPWTMAAGGALVSSPVIIHLINRMRFKRVRWAAMEFVLKSQKRNRRRLIVEQLLLLLLRILAVLLAALLLARFLGFSPNAAGESSATLHAVLIDDTPSMGDRWVQDGEPRDTFETVRRVIADGIVPAAAQATTPQELIVLRLSDLANAREFGRLGTGTSDEVRRYLTGVQATATRGDLLAGVEAARKLFDARPEFARTLHVVSDFRAGEWAEGDPEAVAGAFRKLAEANVETHLHDVAHPFRAEAARVPLYHDNLAVTDLRAEARVAARYAPVEFALDVANFSNSERKNVRITVRLNGQERAEASTNLPSVPANQVTTARFAMAFDRVATKDKPLDRFSLVSATLEGEDAGLAIDNTRHAVMEVRERVPILIVEGNAATQGTPDADGYRLRSLFGDTLAGFDPVVKGVAELERPTLRAYSSIFLVNVRELSKPAVANLTNYVKLGGGLGFFLGPNSRADFYTALHDEGRGLFPAPLSEPPSEGLKPEERAARLFSFQMQMFPRDENHPALERLYQDGRGQKVNREQYNKDLRFVVLDRWFPVPRLKWKPDPARVRELVTLPNYGSMAEYERAANALLDRLRALEAVPGAPARALVRYREAIRSVAASAKPLFNLGNAVEEMLTAPGDPRDPEGQPNMPAFWARPEAAELRGEFERFLSTVRYGDPLYLAATFGGGRVTAFLTTATSEWNDLDGYGKAYFPPLVIEMQRYLAGAGTDVNRTVGDRYEERLDPAVYVAKAKRTFLSEERGEGRGGVRSTDLGEVVPPTAEGQLALTFTEAKEPGAVLIELATQRTSGAQGDFLPDYRAAAFNVDAAREGNLRRADRDEILKRAPGAAVHAPDSDLTEALSKRRKDWSESPWLYLGILLVLLAEQAMAVRLSFHTAEGEALPAGARQRVGRR